MDMDSIRRLRLISEMEMIDKESWLSIVEDLLRQALPGDSRSIARFAALREAASKEEDAVSFHRCRELVYAICRMAVEQAPREGALEQEVERIIQKGYFNSIYFRAVLGGLGL